MNWKTHKRLLISEAMPVAVLAGMLAFLPASKQSYGTGFHYFDFFRTDPLSAAFNLLTSLITGAYLIYLNVGPIHPRHRGFFVLGIFVSALVINGIYAQALSHTAHFFAVDGMLTFFTSTILFYCIYRLAVLLPLTTRKWVTPAMALLLFGIGLFQVCQLYTLSTAPCLPGSPPNLWLELTGHCA
jgi:predicted MFS family arabinose efflux permease